MSSCNALGGLLGGDAQRHADARSGEQSSLSTSRWGRQHFYVRSSPQHQPKCSKPSVPEQPVLESPSVMSGRVRYIWAFVGSATTATLLVHYLNSGAPSPLPWWPHTFAIGAVLGALIAVVTVRMAD